MEISIQKDANSAVIDVSGRLVYGAPVRDLHDAVRQLVSQGIQAVVVNLDQVSYLDTTGIEVLVASYATCTQRGAGLRLINPNPKARRALHITRLDALFGIAPS